MYFGNNFNNCLLNVGAEGGSYLNNFQDIYKEIFSKYVSVSPRPQIS